MLEPSGDSQSSGEDCSDEKDDDIDEGLGEIDQGEPMKSQTSSVQKTKKIINSIPLRRQMIKPSTRVQGMARFKSPSNLLNIKQPLSFALKKMSVPHAKIGIDLEANLFRLKDTVHASKFSGQLSGRNSLASSG
jgi:hypothetical protein